MKKIILAISIFTLVLSCSKEDTPTVEQEKPVDFYAVGGNYPTSGSSRAILWKNGVATFLTDGTYQARAYSVYVDQGNTYVVGEENGQARYWKNGVLQDMGILTADYFTNVQVVNNKVYILGRDGSEIKLWEDSVPTTITGFSGTNPYPCGFKVVGNDKYVLIHSDNTSNLWKNGTNTVLSDGIKLDTTRDLCVVGSNTYVLAEESYNGARKLKYWKNGVVNYINNASNNVRAFHIDVYNSNVYIGGALDYKANYWKNGVATQVGLSSGNSFNYGIQVLDNNIYTINLDNNNASFMKNKSQVFNDIITFSPDLYDCFVVYK